MKFLVTFLALFCSALCYSQDNNHKHWSKDSLLTWSDFKGQMLPSDNLDAFTYTNFNYTYTMETIDGKSKPVFTVDNSFRYDKSWSKPDKQTAALLQHEQGHFDISEYFGRQLLTAFNTYQYTDNIKDERKAIFQKMKTEMAKMHELYDIKTKHSADAKMQAKWNAFIALILAQNVPLDDVIKSDFVTK